MARLTHQGGLGGWFVIFLLSLMASNAGAQETQPTPPAAEPTTQPATTQDPVARFRALQEEARRKRMVHEQEVIQQRAQREANDGLPAPTTQPASDAGTAFVVNLAAAGLGIVMAFLGAYLAVRTRQEEQSSS